MKGYTTEYHLSDSSETTGVDNITSEEIWSDTKDWYQVGAARPFELKLSKQVFGRKIWFPPTAHAIFN